MSYNLTLIHCPLYCRALHHINLMIHFIARLCKSPFHRVNFRSDRKITLSYKVMETVKGLQVVGSLALYIFYYQPQQDQ